MSNTDMSGVSTQDISGANVTTSSPEPQPDVVAQAQRVSHNEPEIVVQDMSGVVFSNGCPPWRQ